MKEDLIKTITKDGIQIDIVPAYRWLVE